MIFLGSNCGYGCPAGVKHISASVSTWPGHYVDGVGYTYAEAYAIALALINGENINALAWGRMVSFIWSSNKTAERDEFDFSEGYAYASHDESGLGFPSGGVVVERAAIRLSGSVCHRIYAPNSSVPLSCETLSAGCSGQLSTPIDGVTYANGIAYVAPPTDLIVRHLEPNCQCAP